MACIVITVSSFCFGTSISLTSTRDRACSSTVSPRSPSRRRVKDRAVGPGGSSQDVDAGRADTRPHPAKTRRTGGASSSLVRAGDPRMGRDRNGRIVRRFTRDPRFERASSSHDCYDRTDVAITKGAPRRLACNASERMRRIELDAHAARKAESNLRDDLYGVRSIPSAIVPIVTSVSLSIAAMVPALISRFVSHRREPSDSSIEPRTTRTYDIAEDAATIAVTSESNARGSARTLPRTWTTRARESESFPSSHKNDARPVSCIQRRTISGGCRSHRGATVRTNASRSFQSTAHSYASVRKGRAKTLGRLATIVTIALARARYALVSASIPVPPTTNACAKRARFAGGTYVVVGRRYNIVIACIVMTTSSF